MKPQHISYQPFGMSRADIQIFLQSLNCSNTHDKTLMKDIYRYEDPKLRLSESVVLPKNLKEEVANHFNFKQPIIHSATISKDDLSVKFLLKLQDNHLIEAVLIPVSYTHLTLPTIYSV